MRSRSARIVDRDRHLRPYEGAVWFGQPLTRRAGQSPTTRAARRDRRPVLKLSGIDVTSAFFEAKDKPREYQPRSALAPYEQGVTEVDRAQTNPGSKHLARSRHLTPCNSTFEGSLGYFVCGIIDGPEIHITVRVGCRLREKKKKQVDFRRSSRSTATRGSLTGAAIRGGTSSSKAVRPRAVGIDQRGGGTIISPATPAR